MRRCWTCSRVVIESPDVNAGAISARKRGNKSLREKMRRSNQHAVGLALIRRLAEEFQKKRKSKKIRKRTPGTTNELKHQMNRTKKHPQHKQHRNKQQYLSSISL